MIKTTTRKKLSKPVIKRSGLSGLKRKLAAFEKKYQMPTPVFVKKAESGELEESDDFIDWLGLAEIYQHIMNGKIA